MARLLAVAASLLLAACSAAPTRGGGTVVAQACPDSTPAAATVHDSRVASFDGVEIAVSVFRPPDACAARPVPVVLTTHGWGRRRDTAHVLDLAAGRGLDGSSDPEDVARGRMVSTLLGERYGVVSIDARGHGDSGGFGSILEPRHEVRDFMAVIDRVAELEWVARDGRGDPRVGAIGASYGGTFQLLTAAFDPRLDALVPIVAWNDLATSIAPHGAVGAAWGDVLRSVTRGRTLAPGLRRRVAAAVRSGRLDGTLVRSTRASSPGRWLSRVRAPAFLVHGMRDGLVPVNEAAANFVRLRAAGSEAWLWGYDAGHAMLPVTDAGAGPSDPCRAQDARPPVLEFLAAYLHGDPAARERLGVLPRVSLATDAGGCVRAGAWPPATSAGVVDVDVADVRAGAGVTGDLVPDAGATLAGVTQVVASVDGPPGAVVGFALGVSTPSGSWRPLHDAETLLRLGRTGPDRRYHIDLPAVATTLRDGEVLTLRVRHDVADHALAVRARVAVPGRA